MSTWQQIGYLVKKNLLISMRNKEFLVESILPIVVAAMLSLKGIIMIEMIRSNISNLIIDAFNVWYCIDFYTKIYDD